MSNDLIDLPFAEKIDMFIDCVLGGRHHTQAVVDNQHFYLIKFQRNLSTWDGNTLTAVVVAARDLGLRVDVQPNGTRALQLMIHNRASREGIRKGHPTLEQHLEMIARVRQ